MRTALKILMKGRIILYCVELLQLITIFCN